MCGIIGVIGKLDFTLESRRFVDAMKSIKHRGPDDEAVALSRGEFFDIRATQNSSRDAKQCFQFTDNKDSSNIVLGHVRLSILDLSIRGLQPMLCQNGEVALVYNGEIYNYLELRRELEGFGESFESNTDSEVILKAYRNWGNDCVKKFVGMWAFAIVDLQEKTAFCSRDRFGIKPFFYVYDRNLGEFAFASEIKALRRIYGQLNRPNMGAIQEFIAYERSDNGNHTFFKDIFQLPPGHSITLSLEDIQPKIQRYYDLPVFGKSTRLKKSNEAVSEVRDAICEAVTVHLRSDVPVGTALSGGIDSSTIVGFMAQHLENIGGTQHTFSSVFPGQGGDESFFIDVVAKRWNTCQRKVSITPQTVKDKIADLLYFHDAPLGSFSTVAQAEVFRLASAHGVKVMLDGQGGDEVFSGYACYKQPLVRQAVRGDISRRYLISGFLLKDLLKVLLKDVFAIRKTLPIPSFLADFPDSFSPPDSWPDMVYNRFYVDGLPSYLRYEDRNSMAASVESRVPLLDHRLVEVASRLDPALFWQGGLLKWPLRQAASEVLPTEVYARRDKIGFATPQAVWMRGELKNYILECIGSLRERNLIDAEELERYFKQYVNGQHDDWMSVWRAVSVNQWMQHVVEVIQ